MVVLPAALDRAAEVKRGGESLLAQPLELGFGGAGAFDGRPSHDDLIR